MSFHETVYLFGGIISDFGNVESNSVSIYEHDAWVIQGEETIAISAKLKKIKKLL